MIVLIEGGEKAGKTTIANRLVLELNKQGWKTYYRHWGPYDPEYFASIVQKEADDTVIHVWDRGWISESVYARLLDRKDHNKDPWLQEFLYGRATHHKFLILNDLLNSKAVHTVDDLPVDPMEEQREFYCQCHDTFETIPNTYSDRVISESVAYIMAKLIMEGAPPFIYSGIAPKYRIPVFFVASPSNMARGTKWMPFSYDRCVEYIRPLGNLAFKCQYMFAHKGNPAALRNAEYIITLGGDAAQWVKYYVGKTTAKVFAADMLRANIAHKEAITNLIDEIKDTYNG
jgi:nicotinamide riboside kinase